MRFFGSAIGPLFFFRQGDRRPCVFLVPLSPPPPFFFFFKDGAKRGVALKIIFLKFVDCRGPLFQFKKMKEEAEDAPT